MENFFSSFTEVDGRFGGLGWDFSGVEGLSKWDWVISSGAESGTGLLRHGWLMEVTLSLGSYVSCVSLLSAGIV